MPPRLPEAEPEVELPLDAERRRELQELQIGLSHRVIAREFGADVDESDAELAD